MLPMSMDVHTGTLLMRMVILKNLSGNGALACTYLIYTRMNICIPRFKRTGRRNEIFLASKFGVTFDPKTGPGVRGDKEYVKEASDRSLRALGVDAIDLYYLHR